MQHLRVFVTTAIISLWAYVWMLVVYLWWTPSEVRHICRHIGIHAKAGLLRFLTRWLNTCHCNQYD